MELAVVIDRATMRDSGGSMPVPLNREQLQRIKKLIQSNLETNACLSFLRVLTCTETPISTDDRMEFPLLRNFVSDALEQLITLGLVTFTWCLDPTTGMRCPQVLDSDTVQVTGVGQQWTAQRGWHRVYTAEYSSRIAGGKSLPPIFIIDHADWKPSLRGEIRTPLISVLSDIVEANALR